MITLLISSFSKLKKYCENERFMGWDPYDGLNSKLFQIIPFFKNSALARLIVIQGFKRLPINLRKIALVPKEYNAKGIGLFLSGYCNLYKSIKLRPELKDYFGSEEELTKKIIDLSELLISLQSKGDYNGACWGYNFDWQARRLFLFPKFTPTVVATYFCASALFEAYDITKRENYLKTALSSSEFIIKDLHRTKVKGGFLFSYSPLPGNDSVYNASILGSALLSLCYKYERNEEYLKIAKESINACCEAQANNGSWVYGCLPLQSWIDSFHTGYNLQGINTYLKISKDSDYDSNLKKGLSYYLDNFFLENGLPKYYNNKIYPIDIHCPGELFIVLNSLNEFQKYKKIAFKVLDWTIKNMQNKKGYFYYQLKKGISSRISYMRWSNAFMFNALSHYLLASLKNY